MRAKEVKLRPQGQLELQVRPKALCHSLLPVSGSREEEEEEEQKEAWPTGATGGGHFVDDFMDFDAPFNCRLSLKDFDTLIHDLDRELAKQINICL